MRKRLMLISIVLFVILFFCVIFWLATNCNRAPMRMTEPPVSDPIEILPPTSLPPTPVEMPPPPVELPPPKPPSAPDLQPHPWPKTFPPENTYLVCDKFDPTSLQPYAVKNVDVESILKTMEFANIVFNVPYEMRRAQKESVKLVLSLTKEEKELIHEFKQSHAESQIQSSKIKISDKMRAELSGSAFTILAITPTEQLIDKLGDTQWIWEVVAKESGNQVLYLTINMVLDENGNETQRCVQSFSREIQVHVNAYLSIKEFFKSNWQWLWGALVPVAIWWWTKRKKKRTSHINKK